MKDLNIYFHIPYCKAKCRFCSFYVIPGRKSRLEDYFIALKSEIKSYKDELANCNIKTIYVGGGTPSLVDSVYITDTIHFIKENFNVDNNCEISVENNPETLTEEKIKDYYSVGVNRLSIGLQATQDEVLKFMGRLYTFEEFKEKYSIAKESKIKNINLDLIFGIPTLSIANWEEALYKTIELEPHHISTYSLEIDENSIFGYLERKGRFKRMEESLDRKMYKLSKKILKNNDYKQYEISNSAKEGYECNHNLNIWKGQDYIGFGASSHSRFANQRYNNINSLENYIELVNQGLSTKENIQNLNQKDLLNERIILNLRTSNGIDLENIKKDFNIDFKEYYKEEMERLFNQKLIKLNKGFLSLTSKGQDLENIVNLELINI